jgi:hypothetical protein
VLLLFVLQLHTLLTFEQNLQKASALYWNKKTIGSSLFSLEFTSGNFCFYNIIMLRGIFLKIKLFLLEINIGQFCFYLWYYYANRNDIFSELKGVYIRGNLWH